MKIEECQIYEIVKHSLPIGFTLVDDEGMIIDIANVIGISEVNAEQWVNSLKEAGKLKERQYNEKKYYSCPLG